MIKDRGSKKWTSIFLPEHVERIRSLNKELREDKKPDLDDFELSLISEEIERAYKSKCDTTIKFWQDGKIIPRQGTVEGIDIQSKIVLLHDPFGIIKIPFKDIVSVTMIN